jgi:hypothetical protein
MNMRKYVLVGVVCSTVTTVTILLATHGMFYITNLLGG